MSDALLLVLLKLSYIDGCAIEAEIAAEALAVSAAASAGFLL